MKRPSKPVSRVLYPDAVPTMSEPIGTVAIYLDLMLPSGSSDQPGDRTGRSSSPYSVLLQMGFARPPIHTGAGELLPRHFTLTPIYPINQLHTGRYVSVALSVGSPLLGVTQHLARWSSDFPPR